MDVFLIILPIVLQTRHFAIVSLLWPGCALLIIVHYMGALLAGLDWGGEHKERPDLLGPKMFEGRGGTPPSSYPVWERGMSEHLSSHPDGDEGFCRLEGGFHPPNLR